MAENLLENKKARMKYALVEEYEAGIELFGYEVKSLRVKRGSLDGARVTVRGGEVYLLNAHIPAYQPKNAPENYDSKRQRRLLLNKKEIAELAEVESQKGLTIVPLSVYNSGRNIKVRVATVRGKKKYDHREDIKKRDTDRDIRRTLKNQ